MFARARRKEIHLGGCMFSADVPAHHCTSCGQDSGTNEELQALLLKEPSEEERAKAQSEREEYAKAKEARRKVLKERARRK